VGVYPWLRVVAMRRADQLRAKKREAVRASRHRAEIDGAERESRDSEAIERHDPPSHASVELCFPDQPAPAGHPPACVEERLAKRRPESPTSRATFDVVLHRAMAALKRRCPRKEAEKMTMISTVRRQRIVVVVGRGRTAAVLEALRSAWAPAPLDPARNEALIALALEDPLAPASAEEIAESERLRRALEGDGDHPYAELARALAAAGRPGELEHAAGERLVGEVQRPEPPASVRVAETCSMSRSSGHDAGARLDALPDHADATRRAPERCAAPIPPASTASMFQEKFETEATTERVDRIAPTRARELVQPLRAVVR
jgi:hypothetical protein